MKTATTIRLSITRLLAASADVGFCQPPGGAQTEKTCCIYARRDGRWEAIGEVREGGNQGYFQVNYEYGPWCGRGDTPRDAVANMNGRADADYCDDMRKAGHDALLECEGKTFASLAADEARRVEAVTGPTKRVRIGDTTYWQEMDAEEQAALRARAVKLLRRLAGGSPDLSAISDTDLLAEVRARGLS